MTIAVESEVCDLQEIEALRLNKARAGNAGKSKPSSTSTLLRWWKFNLVGGIGIVVQFAALFLLKSMLHFNYLVATAIAVEIAVLHNFIWHERFTWAERVGYKTGEPGIVANASSRRHSLRRLLRFHLTNGAVSILGNLALMRVMVGFGHMNYLAANAVAIAICSIVNFIASERWVFEKATDS